MTSAQQLTRTPKFRLAVSAVEQLSPHMRRLVLSGPSVAEQAWPLGCEVAVVLSGEDGREVRRRYTVRSVRGADLTIDALLHGPSVGSTWASTAQPGDLVELFGPRGEIPLPTAQPVLAITDEAGLPAVAALAEAFPGNLRVLAEISDDVERYPLPASAETSWIVRGSAPAGDPELLLNALNELSTDYEYAYAIAESRAVLELRDALQARGLHRVNIYFKGYWNLRARSTR